jgi:hypothetical protein
MVIIQLKENATGEDPSSDKIHHTCSKYLKISFGMLAYDLLIVKTY